MRSLKRWVHRLLPKGRRPKTAIFRVDAGRIEEVSFGHVSRCLILAETLRRIYGIKSVFLMRDFPEGVNHVLRRRYQVTRIPRGAGRRKEAELMMRAVDRSGADMLFIDMPYEEIDTSYYSALRGRGLHIVFMDDNRFIYPDADVILNSNIVAPERLRHAAEKDHKKREFLLGMDYFIFGRHGKGKPPRKKGRRKNILLTFGGSDPENLTLKVLKALIAKGRGRFFFDIIAGPGNSRIDEIKKLIYPRRKNFRLNVNPPDLEPFLRTCDFAVCAGGRTMYELLSMKKKFLPIASTGHEADAIAELVRRRMIVCGMRHWSSDLFLTNLNKMLGILRR